MSFKVVEVPAGEYKAYLAWLSTPGLTIPAGKTTVQAYLDSKEQNKLKRWM